MSAVELIDYNKRLKKFFAYIAKEMRNYESYSKSRKVDASLRKTYKAKLEKMKQLNNRSKMLEGRLDYLFVNDIDFSNKVIFNYFARYYVRDDIDTLVESSAFSEQFISSIVKRMDRNEELKKREQLVVPQQVETQSKPEVLKPSVEVVEIPVIQVQKQPVAFTPVDLNQGAFEQLTIFDYLN